MNSVSTEPNWDAIFGKGGTTSAEIEAAYVNLEAKMEAEYASSRAVAANYDVVYNSFANKDPFVDANDQGPVSNTAFTAVTLALQPDVSTEPAWMAEMASKEAPSFLMSEHTSSSNYPALDDDGIPEFVNSSDVSFVNMQSDVAYESVDPGEPGNFKESTHIPVQSSNTFTNLSMQRLQEKQLSPSDSSSMALPQYKAPATDLTPSVTPSAESSPPRPEITCAQVENFLRSSQGDPQHQQATTLFQDDAGAKRWRKRGQAHASPDPSDAAFPRNPAEQREYVALLISAFKYMGPGTKYNPQEYVFMTKSRNPDREKQIEAWCWQLLTQIIRRQSTGRPFDLAKRTKGNLDCKDLDFAERFSTVYNALKFEKRCAIRFCNLAGWHKRFANDPFSEMAEIAKNDWINHLKAAQKKALEEEVGKGNATPKKRGAGDVFAEGEIDSPSTSTSEYEPSRSRKVRATRKRAAPWRKSTLSKVQDNTQQTSRWRGPSAPISSSETSPSRSTYPSSPSTGWDSPSAVGQSNGNFSQQTNMLGPGRFKKLKLDNGSAESSGRPKPSRSAAAYDPSRGSGQMRRSSSLREISLPPTDIAEGAPPQYNTSGPVNPTPGPEQLSVGGNPSSRQPSMQPASSLPSAQQMIATAPAPVLPAMQIPDAVLAVDTRVLPTGFTPQQLYCARRMGMYTHEYVNYARIRNNIPPIDWAKHMRPRPGSSMPS